MCPANSIKLVAKYLESNQTVDVNEKKHQNKHIDKLLNRQSENLNNDTHILQTPYKSGDPQHPEGPENPQRAKGRNTAAVA